MTGSEKTDGSHPHETPKDRPQATEEKYRLIIENMTDVIWQTSTDLIITYVTPSVNKLLGYDAQELVGQSVLYLLTSESQEPVRDWYSAMTLQLAELNETNGDVLEVECNRKDGTTVWTEMVTVPAFDNAGLFVGFRGIARDISRRKGYEEALRASEEKFSEAFMLSPDAIAISRLSDGVIILINDGFTKTLCYEPDEVVGKTAAQLNIWNNPEDRDAIIKELKQKGAVNSFETSSRTKNGQIRYGIASASIIELNGAQHVIFIVKDITDRKRRENTLLQREKKFRKAFFRSPDVISISKLSDGIILSVNEGLKQSLGYPEDEADGNTAIQENLWADLEDKDRFEEEFKAEGKVTNFEASFRSQDGDIKRQLMSSATIMLNGEEHIFNVLSNITDRNLAEEALRASERKYRLLFDISPIGIILVDTEGKILEVNYSVLQIIGSPSLEDTKAINILTFPSLIEAGISDLFISCMRQNRTIDTELFYTSRWGEETCLRIILTPKLNEQGYVEGCLALMEDVMPRKKAEKELKAARDELELRVEERTNKLLKANKKLELEIAERERAEQELQRSHLKLELALTAASQLRIQAEAASAAKTEFLTNMSHELRTPLTAVIGFSDLLGEQLFGKLNEKQLGYVTEISSAGRHLLRLINDILDLAKVESGKMDIRMSPVDLPELLGHCVIMIRETAMKRGLTVELKVSEQLDGKLLADDVRLKQILMNLLSNAAKFTPSGGAILLAAERRGEEVLVSVSDTGVGLKLDDQKRIFQTFEQLDSSFSRQEQGTGLGLALVRKLVELHGGRVWVESEGENKGSVFSFTIPFMTIVIHETRSIRLSENGDGLHPRLRRPYSEKENPPTVMVVEDNNANLKLVTDLLEAGGYNVIHSVCAEEAIKRAEREKLSLILMDISLPGMDGLTATKVLKSNPATAPIPIVALTAHAMKDDEARAWAAGCDAYILKPIDTIKFYRILADIVLKP